MASVVDWVNSTNFTHLTDQPYTGRRGIKKCPFSAESLDFRLVFGGPFGAVTTEYERFRGRRARREGFADLRRPHESFRARLETRFGPFRQKCEGFKENCDFAFKKFDTQGLNFLYGHFLIQIRPVR